MQVPTYSVMRLKFRNGGDMTIPVGTKEDEQKLISIAKACLNASCLADPNKPSDIVKSGTFEFLQNELIGWQVVGPATSPADGMEKYMKRYLELMERETGGDSWKEGGDA